MFNALLSHLEEVLVLFVVTLEQVPVLSRSECAQQPGSSVPHRDQLCAGLSGSSHTACPGDSGGGLMARDQASGRWDLIGVVSTGGDLVPSQNIVT